MTFDLRITAFGKTLTVHITTARQSNPINEAFADIVNGKLGGRIGLRY